jgi:hypothetical protein
MKRNRPDNSIEPWNRIAVDATTAAEMMSCGRSTFFDRVRRKIYPQPGPDGRWSVNALRMLHQASPTTTASNGDDHQGTTRGYTQREQHQSPGAQAAAQ